MARNNGKARQGKSKEAEAMVDLFGENSEGLRQLVESVCQEIIEAEITQYLGAETYERSEGRTGYRNGYKPRTIKTRVGELHFQVPQSRDGKFSPELFQRYQRSEKALRLTLMEMFLQGVSTRKVEKLTEALCGTDFSASLVSHLCKQLDATIDAFRKRPLKEEYPYLIIDARYEKVRVNGQVVDQAVLIIVGVNDKGYREVLGIEIADLESESTWGDIFRQLKDRGLKGVRLVVSDDHRGLRNALTRYFTGCAWQRCRVHFIRNICGYIPRWLRKNLITTLHQIWDNTAVEHYEEDVSVAIKKWAQYPKVAAMLENDLCDTMQIMHIPEEHRDRLTTTNSIERVNQLIKARTRIVRIFPNRESCVRLIAALLMELHEEWITGHRYLTFQEPDESVIEKQTALAKAT